jgi:hypothetical protein
MRMKILIQYIVILQSYNVDCTSVVIQSALQTVVTLEMKDSVLQIFMFHNCSTGL